MRWSGYSAAIHDQKNSNQVSLFGEAGDDLPEPRLSAAADWLPAERLSEEFKAVGFYLSGHPLDDYMAALKRTEKVLTLDEVTAKAAGGGNRMQDGGKQLRGAKNANPRAATALPLCNCPIPRANMKSRCFSDTLEASRDHLETGTQVVIGVEATMEAEQLKLLGRSVVPADMAVANAGSSGLRVCSWVMWARSRRSVIS